MTVTVGFLLIATGVAFLLLVRRRGVCRAVGVFIALAVGTTVLTLSGAQLANADSCTSAAPAVAPAVGTTTTTAADTSTPGSVPPVVTSPVVTSPVVTGPVVAAPGAALPEASQVVAFPAIGVLVMGGYLAMRSRRNRATSR